MRGWTIAALLVAAPSAAGGQTPDPPAGSVQALALLAAGEAALGAYEGDPEAMAAAPDAIGQAREAIGHARALLLEGGVEHADLTIRRAGALLELISQLIAARSLEKDAAALADDVVEALERLAAARAAYERVTEQLHLYAVPFPGGVGP